MDDPVGQGPSQLGWLAGPLYWLAGWLAGWAGWDPSWDPFWTPFWTPKRKKTRLKRPKKGSKNGPFGQVWPGPAQTGQNRSEPLRTGQIKGRLTGLAKRADPDQFWPVPF